MGRSTITHLCIAVAIALQATPASAADVLDYVDVFIGTSNSRWMLGPYACRPFGMVQLGPDNQNQGWMAGYEYSINNVTGFSHIHAWTMSGVLLMPQVQDPTFKDSPVDSAYRGAGASYHSRVLKESEVGSPGYYAVELYDSDAKAELTAAKRCGFHRYTFHDDYPNARVMIDLAIPTEYGQKLVDGAIEQTGPRSISGHLNMKGFTDYALHIVIHFNQDIQRMHGWTVEDGERSGVSRVKGRDDVSAYVTPSRPFAGTAVRADVRRRGGPTGEPRCRARSWPTTRRRLPAGGGLRESRRRIRA